MKKERLRQYSCCFIGHRKILKTNELKCKLYNIIENLIINYGVNTFLFGSRSQFDQLCYDIVTQLKEKHDNISRIYVRAEFPYIRDSFTKYLLERYEYKYYPEKIINAGRASYVERNHEMINKSAFCVMYYDKNYLPPRRKNSHNDVVDYQPKSGTALAYNYAKRKGVKIINLMGEKEVVV